MKSGNMNGVSFQNGRMTLPTGSGLGMALKWNFPLKWTNHMHSCLNISALLDVL